MKTIKLTGLVFDIAHNAHNLGGLNEDLILDNMEASQEARTFTNRVGFRQTYLLVRLPSRDGFGSEVFGAGFTVSGTTLLLKTLLTPEMVLANEAGTSNVENFEALNIC